MRGKDVNDMLEPALIRITPAHAGKSSHRTKSLAAILDHPRPCGEKTGIFTLFHTREGSPPPMRGKARDRSRRSVVSGITPAHAGKSPSAGSFFAHGKDHPRPCGEKMSSAFCMISKYGSPPPMRGKALLDGFIGEDVGITPAHAGKSALRYSIVAKGSDHPRPCGEKPAASGRCAPRRGSPPPMRGKAGQRWQNWSRCRITPAHAGKSKLRSQKSCTNLDHPRPCGEKRYRNWRRRVPRGSPPPMRGKVFFCMLA